MGMIQQGATMVRVNSVPPEPPGDLRAPKGPTSEHGFVAGVQTMEAWTPQDNDGNPGSGTGGEGM